MPTARVDYYEQARNEEELLLNLDFLDEKKRIGPTAPSRISKSDGTHYNAKVRPWSF